MLPESRKVFHHETVYIDLRSGDEVVWSSIRKGHRSSIKKAVKSGVKIICDEEVRWLGSFYEFYLATMRRQRASLAYFFPASFFEHTLRLLGRHASLFVAKHEEKVMSVAILLQYGDYVHYHFSRSDTCGLPLCANHLLVYEAAWWAQNGGAKNLHLGGGLTANDNLFMFKSGFSPRRGRFYTYRRVHDPEAYARLVQMKIERETEDEARSAAGFFPRYRA